MGGLQRGRDLALLGAEAQLPPLRDDAADGGRPQAEAVLRVDRGLQRRQSLVELQPRLDLRDHARDRALGPRGLGQARAVQPAVVGVLLATLPR